MATTGLVAHQDVPDPSVVEGVVRREVGAARQPEYHVNTLCLETFHQCVDCTHSARLLSQSARNGAACARREVPSLMPRAVLAPPRARSCGRVGAPSVHGTLYPA